MSALGIEVHGKSAKEAVGDLTFQLQYGKFGYGVEADIQGFFDNH